MVALPVNNKPAEDAGGGSCGTGGGCNPDGRCGNGLEKIYPTCAVRYGYMGYIGEFRYSPGMLFNCGGKVVIQTNRGIEIGEQKSLTCSGCDRSISRQQIMKYVKNSGPDFYRLKAGRILRIASQQDLMEQQKLNAEAARELIRSRELVREMSLPMKMVACEHLFGGERIIFHFMSEDRVDFREFVRVLAHEYHTRIELHQVGARDEARLVADYEICGRECCCKNFLKKLRPVSMRMAKLQKATLDPSKVSGRCGRLRCCLRYEHEGYESLDKALPRVGIRLRTEHGVGTVTDRQVLTQLLTVLYDGGKLETVAIEQVLERNLPKPPPGPPPADPRDRGSRPDSGGRSSEARRNGGDPRRREERPPRQDWTPRERPAPPPERLEVAFDEHIVTPDVESEEEVHDDGIAESTPPEGTTIGGETGPAPEARRPRRNRRGRRGRRRGRPGEGGPGGARPHPDRPPGGPPSAPPTE